MKKVIAGSVALVLLALPLSIFGTGDCNHSTDSCCMAMQKQEMASHCTQPKADLSATPGTQFKKLKCTCFTATPAIMAKPVTAAKDCQVVFQSLMTPDLQYSCNQNTSSRRVLIESNHAPPPKPLYILHQALLN